MRVLARRMLRVLTYALIGVCLFVVAPPVFAATVSDAYAQPTSSTISEASNHSFTFTTASAATASETITIVFDTGYTLTSIVEDDVDITDDGADLTTAASCGGSEQVGVGVSGQTLTLTMCSGTTIALGSVVNIEIGTNATASGSGANRVTNPSAAATYFIGLSGTFGDSGSFPMPIVSDDTSGVSALVAPSGGGGGGGGGGVVGGGGDDGGGDDGGGEDIGGDDGGDTVVDTDGETDGTTDTDTGGATDGGTDGTSDGEPAGSSGGDEGGGTTGETSSGDSTTGGTAGGSTNGSSAPTTVTDTTTDGGGDDASTPDVTVDVRIIVDGGIALSPENGAFDAIAGSTSTVVVVVDTTATIESVRVNVDGTEYVLMPTGSDTYTGDVVLPRADAIIDVMVDTVEAPTTYSSFFVDARGSGLVFERRNNSRVAVSGAVVTVYEIVNGVRVPWGGAENPFVVGASGSFAFYVPNGTYVVTAAKSGYEDGASGEIVVRDHILAPSIELVAIVVAEETEETTTEETLSVFAGAVETISVFLATPEVQTAADIAAPATVVLATASIAILASSFNLLPFLQYVFSAPILFFARRKRKAFGVVYSAATKLPVDLAIVRMFAMPDNRLVRSVVTDVKGKYLLVAAPGVYRIEVTKQDFAFPSMLLAGKKDDGTYLDVYTGQDVEVTEQDATIAANIPLDPAHDATATTPARAVILRRFLRTLQQIIALFGVALAGAVLVITPSVFAGVMLLVQIMVYLLVRRLARPKKTKGWGIVYDVVTRKPVGNAVVRLFEPTYNKLVETVVTDRLGRYAFLVGPSEYYVTYSKPGYAEKIVKPIDYRASTEPRALALDVPIEETPEDV